MFSSMNSKTGSLVTLKFPACTQNTLLRLNLPLQEHLFFFLKYHSYLVFCNTEVQYCSSCSFLLQV